MTNDGWQALWRYGQRHGWICLLLAAGMLAAVGPLRAVPAEAAVRTCLPMLAGQEATAASQTLARTQALQNWIKTARGLGPPYTAWRLAQSKRISCRRTSTGYVCQARGRPCRINQVPPRPAPPSPQRRPWQRDGAIEV